MVSRKVKNELILNLLSEPVIAYDNEGQLIKLLPTKCKDVVLADDVGSKRKVARLITEHEYLNLTKKEQSEVEYVRVARKERGRQDREVCIMEAFGQEPDTTCRVYPACGREYNAYDKDCKYHQLIDDQFK